MPGVSLSALPGVSLSALPGVSTIRLSHYIQDLPASRLASDGGVDQSGRTQDFKVDDLEPLTGSVPVTAAVNPQTGGNPSHIHMPMTMPGEFLSSMCGAARHVSAQTIFLRIPLKWNSNILLVLTPCTLPSRNPR